MNNFTHFIYIDESGNGAKTNNLNHFWVSAGVAISFEELSRLNERANQIMKSHMVPGCREIHACDIPHRMLRTSSIAAIAEEIALLLDDVKAHCWVTATSYSSSSLIGLEPNAPAKTKARQLLYEHLNEFLDSDNSVDGDYLIIWDLPDPEEMKDISYSIASYVNPYFGRRISRKLAPAVLCGLSHDWVGLQLADIISNYALHYCGHQQHMPQANREKAGAFQRCFYTRLQRGPGGSCDGIGWRYW